MKTYKDLDLYNLSLSLFYKTLIWQMKWSCFKRTRSVGSQTIVIDVIRIK